MKCKKWVLLSFLLAAILSLLVSICCLLFYDSRIVYGYAETINKEGIRYDRSAVIDVCLVASIELDPNVKTVEIAIPDKLEDGTLVEAIGRITKGKEFFDFKLKGESLKYCSIEDENQAITDYYVTLKLGKNIKIAYSLLRRSEDILQVRSTDEYIRINITYEVSPENKWYYSENGKLYEKEGAGFWESTRLYRVWKARKDD